jgi:hypothetical protein
VSVLHGFAFAIFYTFLGIPIARAARIGPTSKVRMVRSTKANAYATDSTASAYQACAGRGQGCSMGRRKILLSRCLM